MTVYCPSCGSNNQPEVKFCTRCGTNLGVVSDALTGKPATKPPTRTADDEHIAKLMKDYYGGRRETITGIVLIPTGILIMAIIHAAGLPAIAAFFIICWMFFWGAASLAGGLGKWIASSAEMKALGIGSQSQFQAVSAQPLIEPPAKQRELTGFSTGPVDFPSVTEQTTRQLNERDYAANPKREPERDR